MKAAITKQFRIIGILFLTIFCGYLLLTLVYLLPNSLLADNVKKSASELLQQSVLDRTESTFKVLIFSPKPNPRRRCGSFERFKLPIFPSVYFPVQCNGSP